MNVFPWRDGWSVGFVADFIALAKFQLAILAREIDSVL
jgi:hypothetical protein